MDSIFNSDFCGFCGKQEIEVEHMVKGPIVNVCNECIKIMNEIIETEKDQSHKENLFGAL